MLGSSDTPQGMPTSQRVEGDSATAGKLVAKKGGFKSKELEGLIASLFDDSQAAQISPYMQVGDWSDVTQINPRSQDLFQSAMGFEQAAQSADAALGLDAIPYRPESVAQGAATQLRTLFEGEKTPSWISGMVKEAADQAANIYSSGNALYSGAARNAITDRAYEAADKAMTGHVGALGKILQGGLNVGATVSQPEYFNPSFVQNPNFITPLQAWALSQGQDAQQMTSFLGSLSAATNSLAFLNSLRED